MSDSNEGLHNKIRGLLRKAESTPYEAEAATFFEKAQQLIAKYAIDQEALWETDPSKREQIHTEDVEIRDRQAGSHYRRTILNQLAINNNCRTWYTPGTDTSTVAGYPSDTMFVLMLYHSVMSHMNYRMASALARHTAEGRSTRTFRKSFTAGFADSIVERLREMRRAQTAQLRTEFTNSGQSTDLVLQTRGKKVDTWVNENMRLGTATYRDSGASDHTAKGAGYMAGKTADLTGGRGGNLNKGKRELNR